MGRKFLIIFFSFVFISNSYSDTTKVLFIGNSYTYFNDLPNLFTHLSASGNKIVFTDMSAPGGYTLEQHKSNSITLSKIKSGIWNYVILQEQSQTPVIEFLRFYSMYPSAIWLDSLIRAYNGNSAFYMTWGRKYGGQQCIGPYCSPMFVDFFHMQDSMKVSYKMISDSLNSLLCPVGEGWRRARQLDSNFELWQNDYSHPTLKGSYLAACVFYASIFHTTPIGLSFTGGLSSADALFCQQCAWFAYTGIKQISNTIPEKFYLFQNYPNPFNAVTRIRFEAPPPNPLPIGRDRLLGNVGRNVSLKIIDVTGREVETLVNGKFQPGSYEVTWDAGNFSSGIYYISLTAGNFRETKKAVLLK